MSGTSARAFAPASVGNVGVGFDILGHTIAGAGDEATVRRIDEACVRIAAIRGAVTGLPLEAERNTAGVALASLRDALGLPFGFELELDKGIALGSGMCDHSIFPRIKVFPAAVEHVSALVHFSFTPGGGW